MFSLLAHMAHDFGVIVPIVVPHRRRRSVYYRSNDLKYGTLMLEAIRIRQPGEDIWNIFGELCRQNDLAVVTHHLYPIGIPSQRLRRL